MWQLKVNVKKQRTAQFYQCDRAMAPMWKGGEYARIAQEGGYQCVCVPIIQMNENKYV